ncbi:hypothetical protein [Pleomorphomonas sp. PLEO]|uniref:hypothetical protein n=1 Tax=Pleomorphomonas sp. PLEO TaxID=3239306 RepID=UPI00351DD4A8
MGGKGSGGHNRLSDAEKIAKGTFRPSRSDDVYKVEAAAKVVTGPWLSSIPEPNLPLDGIARQKYDEITKTLFDQNKLTMATVLTAEQYALQYGQQFSRLTAGKSVSVSTTLMLERMLRDLRIAEEAPVLASPGERSNRFRRTGFSIRAVASSQEG